MPKPADCQFKHLELVVLKDSLALVVLVLQGARLKQQLITFDQAISQAELTGIANKLNAAYAGLTRVKISAKEIKLSAAEKQVTDCLLKMMQAEDEQEYEQSYLDGLALHAQPARILPGRAGMRPDGTGRAAATCSRVIAPEGWASEGCR